jgi:hypothetical protein
MMSRLPSRNVVSLLALSLLVSTASEGVAQPAGRTKHERTGRASVVSFNELQGRIQPGATISVTDATGREVSGKLSALSETSLTLVLHGTTRSYMQSDVSLIRKRQSDSLWNGLLIGMAAGSAPSIYWLFADPNECGGSLCLDDLVVGMMPAAAIGVVVDAAIRRKVIIYRGSTTLTKTSISIAPITTQRRKGVGLTLSF